MQSEIKYNLDIKLTQTEIDLLLEILSESKHFNLSSDNCSLVDNIYDEIDFAIPNIKE